MMTNNDANLEHLYGHFIWTILLSPMRPSGRVTRYLLWGSTNFTPGSISTPKICSSFLFASFSCSLEYLLSSVSGTSEISRSKTFQSNSIRYKIYLKWNPPDIARELWLLLRICSHEFFFSICIDCNNSFNRESLIFKLTHLLRTLSSRWPGVSSSSSSSTSKGVVSSREDFFLSW